MLLRQQPAPTPAFFTAHHLSTQELAEAGNVAEQARSVLNAGRQCQHARRLANRRLMRRWDFENEAGMFFVFNRITVAGHAPIPALQEMETRK